MAAFTWIPSQGQLIRLGFESRKITYLWQAEIKIIFLIAVFGGSAAFSVYCQINEMFPARLEHKLSLALERIGQRVTVLNFGMHDNVVMQEMMTYLLFAQQLRLML